MQPGNTSSQPGPDRDPEDWRNNSAPEDHGSDPTTDRGKLALKQGGIAMSIMAAALFLSHYSIIPHLADIISYLPIESTVIILGPLILSIFGIAGMSKEKSVGFHLLVFFSAFFTMARILPIIVSGGAVLGSQVFLIQGLVGASLYGIAWYQLMQGPMRERYFSSVRMQQTLTVGGAGLSVLIYFYNDLEAFFG